MRNFLCMKVYSSRARTERYTMAGLFFHQAGDCQYNQTEAGASAGQGALQRKSPASAFGVCGFSVVLQELNGLRYA